MARSALRFITNLICLALVSPAALLCWLEKTYHRRSEQVFIFFAHCFAPLPGRLGAYLRRAFYFLTLEKCPLNCHIGYGTIFTHRSVTIGEFVNLGTYTMVGSADIGARSLIGSRVSVLSGKEQHIRNEQGQWVSGFPERMVQIKIGSDTWIGDGSIIMADVGSGCQIGAGSVVSSPVKDNVSMAGNPARFIQRFAGVEGKNEQE